MKFVALVSGGKDSIYSILQAQDAGHELVACVHLARPIVVAVDSDEEREESYMYQTAGSEVVKTLAEECIQVPLIHYVRQGKSVHTSLVYENSETTENDTTNDSAQQQEQQQQQDEVEDLYQALAEAVQRFPQIQAVASGALLSTYQRVRIEHVCQRLQLTSLSYLWRRNSQHALLRTMVHDAGLEAVVVRTAAPPGLLPHRHLNKTLQQLEPLLYRLYDQYRMHVCGEGGEYETLCLYAPGLYRRRLVLDEVEIQYDDPHDDSVGILRIHACHAQELSAQEKITTVVSSPTESSSSSSSSSSVKEQVIVSPNTQNTLPNAAVLDGDTWRPPPLSTPLPRVRRCEGGLWHTCGIISPKYYPPSNQMSEVDLAVQEARDVFHLLNALLKVHQCTAQDVGMVHLYLADISHFQYINQHYRACFGVVLPPSRSCVALGDLPEHRRVMLDCWVLAGSGEYMRRHGVLAEQQQHSSPLVSPYAQAALLNTTIRYRQVLHVQSLSHWAPVCVGPYSQANALLGALHFLAGSIGLWPSTMKLRESWTQQLEQSWKNLAQILDALDQSSLTNNLLSAMVYVSDQIYNTSPDTTNKASLALIADISQKAIKSNAGVVAGLIDDVVVVAADDAHHDGYEDEETRLAIEGDRVPDTQHSTCPLLVVAIPSMPVGAQVEVEIVAACQAAAACLPVTEYRGILQGGKAQSPNRSGSNAWDSAYDFDGWPNKSVPHDTKIHWSIRTLGASGAALATVAAITKGNESNAYVDAEATIQSLMEGLSHAISKTTGTIDFQQLLQIRLYYVSLDITIEESPVVIDVARYLEAVLSTLLPAKVTPAITVVPVHAMEFVSFDNEKSCHESRIALQATFVDPVSLQTELWIRMGRPAE